MGGGRKELARGKVNRIVDENEEVCCITKIKKKKIMQKEKRKKKGKGNSWEYKREKLEMGEEKKKNFKMETRNTWRNIKQVKKKNDKCQTHKSLSFLFFFFYRLQNFSRNDIATNFIITHLSFFFYIYNTNRLSINYKITRKLYI